MKRRFLFLLLTAFVASAMLFSFSSCSKGGDDEDDIDEQVKICFETINAFRTSNTWQWDEGNTTQVPVTGRAALVLDKDLCRVASIRARELVQNFDHTRPNGSSCFTAFSEAGVSLSPAGECIAAGYSTGVSVANGWREEDKNYAGQGHRRILLAANASKVGIAYAYKDNDMYGYYWALVTAQ
ncbi:MAG: hypothetical protein K6E22_09875 [Treponema sp.]|nr:hypothetical protein [Treponema sp.]